MHYLIWAILNIGLIVLFIIICARATKLLRQSAGLLASLFFVLCLFSFVSISNSRKQNIQPNGAGPKNQVFVDREKFSIDSLMVEHIVLEKNLLSEYSLFVTYGRSHDTKEVLTVSALSYTVGFSCGTEWVPKDISVNVSNDEKLIHYTVRGAVKWYLLGYSIFNHMKSFSGSFEVRYTNKI